MKTAERINARLCSDIEVSGSGKHQRSFFGGHDIEVFSSIRATSQNLEGIDFEDMYCDFVSFENKEFVNCIFHNFELFGPFIDGCRFSHCVFNGLLFYGGKLDYSKFEYCTFTRSMALGSNFLGVSFDFCDLRGIEFSSDNMKHFSTLESISFNGGCVSGSTFGDVLLEGSTKLPTDSGFWA